MIKFIFISLLSFFISVSATANKDIGVSSVTTPQSGCQLSNAEQVKVEIFNYGESLTVPNVPVKYTINGGAPITQTPPYVSFDSLETKIVTFTTTADLSAPGTYVFKIYTDLSGETNRTNDTMTVTVINYQNSIGGSVFNNITVCSGMNNDTLFLTGNLGAVDRWEYTDDGGATWVPIVNTNTFQVYNNLSATRKYRVFVKNGLCPGIYSDTATVTVDPQAVGGSVLSSAIACSGSNRDTLQLTGHSGNILKWQYNNGSGWTDISNTTDTLIYDNLTATTSYRAIITSGVCPNDTSDIATITVITTTVGGNILGSNSVCSGGNSDTLQLINHVGEITWWESSTDGGFTWVPISNTDTTLVYNNLTLTTRYRVLVEGEGCPSAYSDTAIVMVDPVSDGGSVIDDDILLCDSINNATLYLVNYTGNVLMWQSLSDPATSWTSISNTSDSLNFSNITANTTFRAIVKNGVCPADTSLPAVITSSITTADFSAPDFCYKDSTYFSNLSSVQNGSINFYTWDFGDNSSTNTKNPIHLFNDMGTYTVSLVITTNRGCTDKVTKNIEVKLCLDYDLTISNLVTPNGDGYNDFWYIENINAYPDCQVSIFNRYGIPVFTTSGYTNNWNGTSEGNQLPDGTYYYVITCQGTEEIFKGHLTILTH